MGIKIFHIIDSLNIGGLENGLTNLINNSDDSFEHVICCLREKGLMAERLSNPNTTIYSLGKKSRDYLMPWKLRNIIKTESPDIVHTRNWGTIDGVIGAKLAGVKKIIHGEHGRDLDDAGGNNFKRNLTRKILSHNIHQFITVSSNLNSWLVNKVGINPDKVITLINGVDSEKFHPAEKKRKDTKIAIGVNPEEILIGSVGRLDKIKNYPLFINALKELKKKVSGFRGIIVGDGAEKRNLEKIITDTGAPVSLAGQTDNVIDYMHAFDIFILPSINEGISNTILEAMASGLPIIATRVGGNPELLEDGVSGFLVESGDVLGLSNTMLDLMNDEGLRISIGENARKRCLEKFSLKRMVKDYEKVYFELIGSS